MKKIFKITVVILVILIAALVLAAHFFLDGAVKRQIETIGPQVTKVDVKLNSVNLMLLSGSGKIKGLVVGNPPGFQSPSSISIGQATLSLQPRSLLSKKIHVRSINVESPEITFEQTLTGNNLLTLRNNLSSSSGSKEEQAKEEAGKKLQVDDLSITGGRIHVLVNALGQQRSATVPLPAIHLKDLGTSPEGITPVELSKEVLTVILEESAKEAAKAVTELSKGALFMSKDAGTNVSGKIGEGIGGLLKKKKK